MDDFLPTLLYMSSISVAAGAVFKQKCEGKAECQEESSKGYWRILRSFLQVHGRKVGKGPTLLSSGEDGYTVNTMPSAL